MAPVGLILNPIPPCGSVPWTRGPQTVQKTGTKVVQDIGAFFPARAVLVSGAPRIRFRILVGWFSRFPLVLFFLSPRVYFWTRIPAPTNIFFIYQRADSRGIRALISWPSRTSVGPTAVLVVLSPVDQANRIEIHF